jgi:hypothetical protein
MTNFTPEDLLLYLYNETSAKKTTAMKRLYKTTGRFVRN